MLYIFNALIVHYDTLQMVNNVDVISIKCVSVSTVWWLTALFYRQAIEKK